MKISGTVHIAALCIVSYAQCMEITQPQETNPLILSLDDNLITQLTTSGKKNKSSPLLFQRQTKRLHLLQKLLNHKATINFSNNSKTLIVWHNKNNKEMVQTLLYEKLLYFINCNTHKDTIKIDYTYCKQNQSFTAQFQANRSLLHIFTQTLTNKLNKIILKLSHEYSSDASVKHNIYSFHKGYQQYITHQTNDHNQNSTDENDTIDCNENDNIDYNKEDNIGFEKLPKSTQRVVKEILDDMDF